MGGYTAKKRDDSVLGAPPKRALPLIKEYKDIMIG
jgi:hypothetical protein